MLITHWKEKLLLGKFEDSLYDNLAKQWLGVIDTDNSGAIDIQEFKSFIGKLDNGIEDTKIEQAFSDEDQ